MSEVKGRQPLPAGKMNLILLGILAVFFAVFFVCSQIMGGTAGRVPGIMTGLGFILTVLEIVALMRARANKKPDEDAMEPVSGLKWTYTIIAVAFYIAILVFFGFIVSTALYLFFFPVMMGYRKWLVNLIFAVVSTIILYLGFVQLFMVRLPEGIIITNLLGR